MLHVSVLMLKIKGEGTLNFRELFFSQLYNLKFTLFFFVLKINLIIFKIVILVSKFFNFYFTNNREIFKFKISIFHRKIILLKSIMLYINSYIKIC